MNTQVQRISVVNQSVYNVKSLADNSCNIVFIDGEQTIIQVLAPGWKSRCWKLKQHTDGT